MAVTAKWYGKGLEGQFSTTSARRVDWTGDTIKVALLTSSYTPDQDAHDFFNDLTNEVVGTGYTAGGETLGGKTAAYDSATNEQRLKASASVWASPSTFTARYAAVYKDTGNVATSPLLGYVDFGGDEGVTAGTFTITWDATYGVLKITAA